jgi:hypothetical protein
LPTRAIRGSLRVPRCEDDVSRPLTNRCSVRCCAVRCCSVHLGAALLRSCPRAILKARWRAESTSLEDPQMLESLDPFFQPISPAPSFAQPRSQTWDACHEYCVPESQQRHRRTRTNCCVCLRRPCSIQCQRQSDVRMRILIPLQDSPWEELTFSRPRRPRL